MIRAQRKAQYLYNVKDKSKNAIMKLGAYGDL